MLSKLLIILAFHDLMDTAVVYRRVCSYCRDKEVYLHGHNYVGFYQKENTGPLEGYPCAKDPGKLMKCATSCVQAQIIHQDTGKTYTYRDCGTFLLQEFGREKINLSYTQYAMILTDLDEAGNTWVFKFCNKEKCLHPSDYDISHEEEEKGKEVVEMKAVEKPCPDQAVSSYVLLIFAILGVIAGLLIIIKVYNKWASERRTGNRVSARINVNAEELLFEQAHQ